MRQRMVTKHGRHFDDPTEEAISSVGFAIVWANSQSWGDKVISLFPWTIITGVAGSHRLRDLHGEIRDIQWGTYHPAIEYPTWTAYDTIQAEKELAECRARLTDSQTREDELGSALSSAKDLGGVLIPAQTAA